MKHLLMGLTVVIVLALMIAGIVFFSTAASPSQFVPQNARMMSLICGIVCLVLATVLLVVAVLAFRPRDDRQFPASPSPGPRHRDEPADSIARPDPMSDSGDGIRPI